MSRFSLSVSRAVLALGMCLSPTFTAWAQADSAQDASEGRLVRNEEGFSLDLAGGFELGRQQDGYYLLGSRTIAGLILVKAMPGLDAAELDEHLRSGYSDSTLQLTPRGAVTEIAFPGGSGKLAEVEGSLLGGEVQGLLAGYLRSSGGGLLLFAVTSPKQWSELQPAADKIARSVRLFIPDPQELIRLWSERLAGFQLIEATDVRGDRSGDNRTAKSYSLCSDGTFHYTEGGGEPATRNRGADSSAGRRTGTWEIVPTQLQADLVFTFEDRTSRSFRLTRDEQETYLDGQRYFVVPNESCP